VIQKFAALLDQANKWPLFEIAQRLRREALIEGREPSKWQMNPIAYDHLMYENTALGVSYGGKCQTLFGLPFEIERLMPIDRPVIHLLCRPPWA